jgi:small subunit ribosomal protein S16
MPTKIRLQRYGKKHAAYFHIVVADHRSKRDGRFIERLGSYNPNSNPATIDLDFDRALYWVTTGAQASDTARAILSYKGVLMRDHLNRGVLKGALTEEQATAQFEKWVAEKSGKILGKKDTLSKARDEARAKALQAEREVNEKRAAAIAAKQQVETVPAEEEVAETEAAPDVEATAEVEVPVEEETTPEVEATTEAETPAEVEAPTAEANTEGEETPKAE